MITKWTDHINDQEAKDKFKLSVENAKNVLERLNDIIKEMDSGIDRQEISPRAYDNSNWPYKQAHVNGYRQCIKDMGILLNLDQRKTNE